MQGDVPPQREREHNRRRCSLADHDAGGRNHSGSAVPDLQAKFINCWFMIDDVNVMP
jgi:hypothetical protein